jgi:hypothetical protein
VPSWSKAAFGRRRGLRPNGHRRWFVPAPLLV